MKSIILFIDEEGNMRRKRTVFMAAVAVIAFLFGVSGCSSSISTESAYYSSPEDEKDVVEAQNRLFTILKTKQALELNDHYLPHVTRFHQEGGLDVGWSPERAVEFQDMFDGGLTLILEDWEIVDVRVYRDTALTAGYATAGWQDADGRGAVGPIRFTYVWIKTEEGWREAHHHVSNFEGALRF